MVEKTNFKTKPIVKIEKKNVYIYLSLHFRKLKLII